MNECFEGLPYGVTFNVWSLIEFKVKINLQIKEIFKRAIWQFGEAESP